MTSSIQEIFSAALEISGDELPRFLSQACGDDTTLLSELNALLQAHRRPDRLFDLEMSPHTVSSSSSQNDLNVKRVEWMLLGEQPGTIIDRYKLIEVIGRGGHGLVFRAAQ